MQNVLKDGMRHQDMRCQGCEKEGAVGRNILPVPDGQFQGKPKYKYLCSECIHGKKEKVEDEREYPF